MVANGVYPDAYTLANVLKAMAVLGLGWLAHTLLAFLAPRASIALPRGMENLGHLLGVMSLVLIGLFWFAG